MRHRIKNIEQVLSIINNGDGGQDFLAVLGGCLRSWKHISLDELGVVHITHMTDSSEEVISKTELKSDSKHIINRAINGGQFFHVPEIKEEFYVVGS